MVTLHQSGMNRDVNRSNKASPHLLSKALLAVFSSRAYDHSNFISFELMLLAVDCSQLLAGLLSHHPSLHSNSLSKIQFRFAFSQVRDQVQDKNGNVAIFHPNSVTT